MSIYSKLFGKRKNTFEKKLDAFLLTIENINIYKGSNPLREVVIVTDQGFAVTDFINYLVRYILNTKVSPIPDKLYYTTAVVTLNDLYVDQYQETIQVRPALLKIHEVLMLINEKGLLDHDVHSDIKMIINDFLDVHNKCIPKEELPLE